MCPRTLQAVERVKREWWHTASGDRPRREWRQRPRTARKGATYLAPPQHLQPGERSADGETALHGLVKELLCIKKMSLYRPTIRYSLAMQCQWHCHCVTWWPLMAWRWAWHGNDHVVLFSCKWLVYSQISYFTSYIIHHWLFWASRASQNELQQNS